MSKRKLRPAIEIVSAIGSLGFDLQHHAEPDISEAVRVLRTVNPEMFDWLVRNLQPGAVRAGGVSPDHPEFTETEIAELRQHFETWVRSRNIPEDVLRILLPWTSGAAVRAGGVSDSTK